jgi:hypothetical protein
MFAKSPIKMIFCLFLSALLTSIFIARGRANTCARGRRACSSADKQLFELAGLPKDANDAEIVQLLDIREKRFFAILLVRYEKIPSALPKLVQIVNDSNTLLPEKIVAAQTLCDFDNTEWLKTMKPLLFDPNSSVAHTYPRTIVAGLLARAGDYSGFQILATAARDPKHYVRSNAVCELRNFGHKTDPVTDAARELLASIATHDPVPSVRKHAIYSLEKIVSVEPEATADLIRCLKANVDSPDKYFRMTCKAKLIRYTRGPKTE